MYVALFVKQVSLVFSLDPKMNSGSLKKAWEMYTISQKEVRIPWDPTSAVNILVYVYFQFFKLWNLPNTDRIEDNATFPG